MRKLRSLRSSHTCPSPPLPTPQSSPSFPTLQFTELVSISHLPPPAHAPSLPPPHPDNPTPPTHPPNINRYIEAQLPQAKRDRLHFFNTFFYKKLSEKSSGGLGGGGRGVSGEQRARANHARVKTWTKVRVGVWCGGGWEGVWVWGVCCFPTQTSPPACLVSNYHTLLCLSHPHPPPTHNHTYGLCRCRAFS